MQEMVGRIDRRTVLSKDEFVRQFALQNRPVVLTEAMADWAARELWTLEWLVDNYGDTDINVKVMKLDPEADVTKADVKNRSASSMPIREFIAALYRAQEAYYEGHETGLRELISRGHVFPYAMFPVQKLTGLNSHFSFPKFHNIDRLSARTFWLSPPGWITQLHADYDWNLFAQVIGRKRFQLYPPDTGVHFQPAFENALHRYYQSEYLSGYGHPGPLQSLLDNMPVAPAFDFVLEPGEMLFIPCGWFHRVTSVDISWSVTSAWVTSAMIARRLPVVGRIQLYKLLHRLGTTAESGGGTSALSRLGGQLAKNYALWHGSVPARD
jgi:hypothetical protein